MSPLFLTSKKLHDGWKAKHQSVKNETTYKMRHARRCPNFFNEICLDHKVSKSKLPCFSYLKPTPKYKPTPNFQYRKIEANILIEANSPTLEFKPPPNQTRLYLTLGENHSSWIMISFLTASSRVITVLVVYKFVVLLSPLVQ